MRSPVTVVASFLIVLLGSLLLLPNFFDFSDVLDRGLAQISQRYGITITHSDRGILRFLPVPQVQYDDVHVTVAPSRSTHPAAAAREPVRYQARAVTLSFSVWALLRGAVSINAVDILGTTIRLDARQLQNAFDVELEERLPIDFTIRDSAVEVILETATLAVTNFSGQGELSTAFKPVHVSGQFDYDGLPIKLDYQASGRAGKRSPIILELDGGDEFVLEFSGFVTEVPTREVSGEFFLSSRQAVAPLLRSLGLDAPRTTTHYLSISGLIYANEAGVQTDRLRVLGLGQSLTLQASLRQATDENKSELFLNISAEKLDMSGVILSDRIAPVADVPALRFLSLLMPLPDQIDAAINIDQINFAGEKLENASINLGFGEGRVQLQRISAQLPFGTSLLAAGQLEVVDHQPRFLGNLALNIVNMRDFAKWTLPATGEDFIFLQKMVARMQLQRGHLSADIDMSPARYAITDVLAQIGDYEQAFDLIYDRGSNPRLQVVLETPLLDLVEWGLVGADDIVAGEKLVSKLPIDQWLGEVLADLPQATVIPVNLKLGALTAGAVRLENVIFSGEIKNAQIHVNQLRIGNYDGGQFDLAGILAHDRRSLFGQLDLVAELAAGQPLTERMRDLFTPVDLTIAEKLRFQGRLVLTAPDDEAWPAVQMQGAVTLDQMNGDGSIFWPSRDLSRLVKDTRMRMRLAGSANEMAAFIGIRPIYAPAEKGLLLANLSMSNNTVGALGVETNLADDKITFTGSVREVGVAREINGHGRVRLQAAVIEESLPSGEFFDAAAQIVMGPTKTSFSGLSLAVGDGTLSGEGVIVYGEKRPELTASLHIKNINLSAYLPEYQNGWSQQPLSWSVLGAIDANLELSAENIGARALTVTSAQAQLKLTDGVIEGQALKFAALGGTIELDILAEGGSLLPSLRLEGRFVDLDAVQLALLMSSAPVIETKLAGKMSLRMRGDHVDAFMAQMTGDLVMDMAAGRLLFVDRTVLSEVASLADVAGETAFDAGLAMLKLDSGRIAVTGGEATLTNGALMTLFGVLDLYGQRYDLSLSLPDRLGRPWVIDVTGDMSAPKARLRPPNAGGVDPTALP